MLLFPYFQLDCCGSEGYKDWDGSKFYNESENYVSLKILCNETNTGSLFGLAFRTDLVANVR